jgi:hypothetical protein
MAIDSALAGKERRMASVFDLLDEVRARPALYLGSDDARRAAQLQRLEQMLSGYTIALRQHGVREPVVDFLREFGDFLWTAKGLSASCGPAVAVVEAAQSEEAAWDLYWALVHEFREAVEARGRSTA